MFIWQCVSVPLLTGDRLADRTSADAVPLISQYPAQDVRDANALDARIAVQHVCKFDRPDSRRQPSVEKLADDRKCEDAAYVKHCSRGFNGEQKRTSVHTFVNSFGTNGSESKGYGIASTFAKTRDDLSTGRGGPYPEHHLPTSEN